MQTGRTKKATVKMKFGVKKETAATVMMMSTGMTETAPVVITDQRAGAATFFSSQTVKDGSKGKSGGDGDG